MHNEGVLAEKSRASEHNFLKSEYAAVAWRAGHHDDARKLLDELGDNVHRDRFEKLFKTHATVAIGEVYAITGREGSQVKKAAEMYSQQRTGEALEILEKVPLDNVNEYARYYLRDRTTTLRMEIALRDEKWLDIAWDKDFTGWTVRSGNWELQQDGAVVSFPGESSPGGGHQYLISNARFEDNYEIRCEVEFGSKPNRARGGIEFQSKDLGKWQPASGHITIVRADEVVKVGRTAERKKYVSAHPPLRDKNTICIQVWHSQIFAYVNGHQVIAGEGLPYQEYAWAPSHMALYTFNPERGGSSVWFRNLRIRGLKSEPSPPSADATYYFPTLPLEAILPDLSNRSTTAAT